MLKGEKALPTMFSTPPKPNFNFLFRFVLSSANAFNLDVSKFLLFGKGLWSYDQPGWQI